MMNLAILSEVQKYIFGPLDLKAANIHEADESQEYAACTFKLDHRKIIFRSAKITPKKVGQFVTLWKRNQSGITEPFDVSDDFDLVIINVNSESHRGQFVFPKSVLLSQGIISRNHKSGKRGFRVYPIWDKAENKQAQKTQSWQLDFFLTISEQTDLAIAKRLYA